MKIGQQIQFYRKRKGLTQEELGKQVGVSSQTISCWEKDDYLPQAEKLEPLANALDITIADIFSEEPLQEPKWVLNDRMFSEERMYKFVKQRVEKEGMTNAMAALPYAWEKHEGQTRKGKELIPYISHPLHMACHAFALGLVEDKLIATILLHDVCEDCSDENGNPIPPEVLPVCREVQEAVALLTKPMDRGRGWEKAYYDGIAQNRLATITKALDRCNNISSMVTGFNKAKIREYIIATEKYVMPLLDIMKKQYTDTCYDAAFLVKYQMRSLLESLKRLL